MIRDGADATLNPGTNTSTVSFKITGATATAASNKVNVALAGTGKIPANYTVNADFMKQNKTEGDAKVATKSWTNTNESNVTDWNGIAPDSVVPADGNYYAVITVKDTNGNVVATVTSDTVFVAAP